MQPASDLIILKFEAMGGDFFTTVPKCRINPKNILYALYNQF